ncbi:hypothetical protein [Gordonia jinghuaiqii]|uniref:Uncharacterized protein n=1 Tax=Gordonia jinghuaiqii TaxID=2758710 RepID=A0A7D7QZY6_9ACTN|nr:hypothetical protein [Gordonia jinghuaiqii]QMT01551.1 hypothetical protein H1R19_22550 [Gordonia jinghuaiqii]
MRPDSGKYHPTLTAHGRRPWPAWVLALIEGFVAYQAISGGLALIDDRWVMPREWLHNTPFDNWTGPGLLLIATIAVPHILAALAIVAPPVSARLASLGGLFAGASLIVWILLQVAFLQIFFYLQPAVAVIGVIEIALAAWWRHLDHRVDDRRVEPLAPAPGTSSRTPRAPRDLGDRSR